MYFVSVNVPLQSVFTKESKIIAFHELFGKFNKTSNAHQNQHLDSTCLEKRGPSTPVILMSLGRSGSSTIWQMISDLTNSHHRKQTREYPGSCLEDNLYFFDTTIRAEEKLESTDADINVGYILRKSGANIWEIPGKDNSVHGVWLQRYMCRLERESQGGIVGFKWKPNLDQFVYRKEARESLQMIASLASMAEEAEQKPPILVVRSRRNMIDVKLSHLKHDQYSNLTAHCRQGDEKCISSHGEKQFVHDIPEFYRDVHKTWNEENLLDDLLNSLGVPLVSVSYDELFYPDQISNGESEWNRMIQFISPSSARLSWMDIHNSTRLVATRSTRSHVEIIENWEDVYRAFQATEIEHLFRKD